MAFTPDTTVHLLNVPWDYSNKNQVRFASESAQRTYMNSRVDRTIENATYQRKDNTMKIQVHIDKIWNINYVAYQNSNFTNKWFYCFVTDMKYVSDTTTELTIKTDVFQTWFFDVSFKESFVVREHVNDDTIGKHLVEEGLETGDFKERESITTDDLNAISYVVGLSDGLGAEQLGRIYSGVYSGLGYYAVNGSNITALNSLIETYVTDGKGDAIAFIFTIPSKLINNQTGWLPSNTNASAFTVPFEANTFDLDGYVPKNKKMFTFPYNCIYASNQQGGHAIYKYEMFNVPSVVSFAVMGNVAPNPTLRLIPSFYGGDMYSQEHALTMTGYPLCSWNNDTFTAWLVQNAPSTGMGFLQTGINALVHTATANPIGLANDVSGAVNQLTTLYQRSLQPDQARGNTNNGNFNIAVGEQRFRLSQYTIRKEFAERIDKFFTMYGYKVATIKVPNLDSRPCWNYVLTNDINIIGNIPDKDMEELKSIFNTGVTLWKQPSYIGNYSLNNV